MLRKKTQIFFRECASDLETLEKWQLGLNAIEQTRIKAWHPQSKGIGERFHKAILQEFYERSVRDKCAG